MLRLLIVSFLSVAVAAVWGQEPEPIKAVNLEKVNTAKDEDDPFVSTDNLGLLYATNAQGSFDIYVSRRAAANQAWPAGKPYPGLSDKDAEERSPFHFRNTLYFASNEILDEKLKKFQNFDIRQRIENRAPLIMPGISEIEDEMHPWVTRAGKDFYFSRKTKEGWLVFRAEGPDPGPIGKAKSVGLPVGFYHATLSAKALTMYVQGPLEDDRVGLFRCQRAKASEPWGKPEELKQLNDPKGKRGDTSPSLSPDGTRLYFASDRPGGRGGLDLWYVQTSQLK